jgi:hypothetical protein
MDQHAYRTRVKEEGEHTEGSRVQHEIAQKLIPLFFFIEVKLQYFILFLRLNYVCGNSVLVYIWLGVIIGKITGWVAN